MNRMNDINGEWVLGQPRLNEVGLSDHDGLVVIRVENQHLYCAYKVFKTFPSERLEPGEVITHYYIVPRLDALDGEYLNAAEIGTGETGRNAP